MFLSPAESEEFGTVVHEIRIFQKYRCLFDELLLHSAYQRRFVYGTGQVPARILSYREQSYKMGHLPGAHPASCFCHVRRYWSVALPFLIWILYWIQIKNGKDSYHISRVSWISMTQVICQRLRRFHIVIVS